MTASRSGIRPTAETPKCGGGLDRGLRAAIGLLTAVSLATACSGSRSDAPPPAAKPPSIVLRNTDSLRAAAAAESVAKVRDEWNRAEVTKRLAEAGLVVVDTKRRVTRSGLGGQGVLFQVSGSDLELYLYSSVAERRRQSAGLDTSAVPQGVREVPGGKELRQAYWEGDSHRGRRSMCAGRILRV